MKDKRLYPNQDNLKYVQKLNKFIKISKINIKSTILILIFFTFIFIGYQFFSTNKETVATISVNTNESISHNLTNKLSNFSTITITNSTGIYKIIYDEKNDTVITKKITKQEYEDDRYKRRMAEKNNINIYESVYDKENNTFTERKLT